MSSLSCSELVGRKVRIAIAEPWDFSSAAGNNALEGTVEAASASDDEWLHCSVSEFVHGGQRIDEVVLVTRHRDKEPLRGLLNGKRVGVNAVFQPGQQFAVDSIDELLSGSAPFLAGSAQLV